MARRFYDLSDTLSNATAPFEFNEHKITYIDPATSAESSAAWGLGPDFWPDRQAWAVETVTLSTHAGTHVDAPSHYGPATSGPGRTIDAVPLEWCYGDGVRLDVRQVDRATGITHADIEAELERVGHCGIKFTHELALILQFSSATATLLDMFCDKQMFGRSKFTVDEGGNPGTLAAIEVGRHTG
jgi:kynurenine formamidase